MAPTTPSPLSYKSQFKSEHCTGLLMEDGNPLPPLPPPIAPCSCAKPLPVLLSPVNLIIDQTK